MIRMNADEQRVIFLQSRAQLRRDALREKNRDVRAEAQELHVRDAAQLREQVFELLVAEQERVAAAEQHVAHFGMLADIADLLREVGMKIVARRVADEPRARAI